MTGALTGLRPVILNTLHDMELELTFEINVTSGFRAGDALAHGKGYAADIAVKNGWQRHELVRMALKHRVPRIGVYSKHVHVDFDMSLPYPVIWGGSYDT